MRHNNGKVTKMGIITADIHVPNEISCKFEMFALRIAQVIQDYLSAVVFNVLSIVRVALVFKNTRERGGFCNMCSCL